MDGFSLRRLFLRLMLGSLAVTAVLGFFGLLMDFGGEFTGRMFGSALLVALFSLTSLGCAWAWEERRQRILSAIGLVLGALTFLACMVLIWEVFPIAYPLEDYVLRGIFMGVLWTLFCTLFGVAGLARLRKNWLWVRYATQVLGLLLALLLTFYIIFQPYEDEPLARLCGAVGILTGCGMISLPVLHRLSRMPASETVVTTTLQLSLTCPRCAHTQTLPAGKARCAQCGLRINIEIEEEHCRNCGYSLYKLTGDRCPECGTPLQDAPVAAPAQTG